MKGKKITPPLPSGGSRICEKGGPEIQIPPGLKKSLSGGGGGGGGTPTFFFSSWIFFCRHLHYWVGVPSAYQTDLRGDKQNKTKKIGRKKKIGQKKGARGRFGPPWIRHCPPPPLSQTMLVFRCVTTHNWHVEDIFILQHIYFKIWLTVKVSSSNPTIDTIFEFMKSDPHILIYYRWS